MKQQIVTLVFLACCIGSRAQSEGFQKLAEVNKCWLEQRDVSRSIAAPAQNMNERDWIQYHLQLVEQTLRARSAMHLNPQQARARAQSLNDLHNYWRSAQFPVNDQYGYRTPIFIDRYNNFCAVGYLIKASGHEDVSRMIAANTNLAYVREMRYPELMEWADAHGFTVDELAWIQPGYPPQYSVNNVGKGTNGAVYEFFADDANNRMYVGGDFSVVDSTIPAANMAYLTITGAGGYEWHAMGSGLTGPVLALESFDGNIFAAGDFATGNSDVAYWTGGGWIPAGCLSGKVHDLAVMNGALYAAGEFEDCGTPGTVALAKWNGVSWMSIPGLTGSANTMHVKGTTMTIGGDFSYQGNALNIIQWNEADGFETFANGIVNEVRDIAEFQNNMLAVCSKNSAADTHSLAFRLVNNQWEELEIALYSPGTNPSMNTLCENGNQLIVGGAFQYIPMVGYYGANSISLELFLPPITPDTALYPSNGQWANVDSTVYRIAIFNGDVFTGGAFQYGSDWSPVPTRLNGIATWNKDPMSVAQSGTTLAKDFRISPNPVNSKSTLSITGAESGCAFTLLDMRGSTVLSGRLEAPASQEIILPEMAPGLYLLRLTGGNGQQAGKTLRVR